MKYLTAIRKQWATRAYARKLPGFLRRDYGYSTSYTPMQIKMTIERNRLNTDYTCYAMSMFSNRNDFDQYHQTIGVSCDYLAMRAEVAATHFHGDVNFTVSEIMEAFADGGHDASGGHGGADGHDGTGH